MKRELQALFILNMLAIVLVLAQAFSAAASHPLTMAATAAFGAIGATAFLVHRRELIPLLVRK